MSLLNVLFGRGRPMSLVVDRDDVAAGDDNRTTTLELLTTTTIEEALDRVRLPVFVERGSTWVAYATGVDRNIGTGKLLAVISQDNPEATWFADRHATMLSLSRTNVSGAQVYVMFRHHGDVSPAFVAQDIRAGVRPRGR